MEGPHASCEEWLLSQRNHQRTGGRDARVPSHQQVPHHPRTDYDHPSPRPLQPRGGVPRHIARTVPVTTVLHHCNAVFPILYCCNAVFFVLHCCDCVLCEWTLQWYIYIVLLYYSSAVFKVTQPVISYMYEVPNGSIWYHMYTCDCVKWAGMVHTGVRVCFVEYCVYL